MRPREALASATFESFRPDPEVTKDHYIEVPIQLDIHGGYHEIGQFLAELSNMKRIMRISNHYE